jgi:hypothetical protein
MAKYTYTGPTKQIGRFGTLRRGDHVDFTIKEEQSIVADKHPHFRKFDPKAKIEPSELDLPDGFDDLSPEEQAKVVAKLKQGETNRKAEVDKANGQTKQGELKELTKAELEDVAAKLNADLKAAGKDEFTIPKGSTRKEIIGLIRAARGEQTHEGDDEE